AHRSRGSSPAARPARPADGRGTTPTHRAGYPRGGAACDRQRGGNCMTRLLEGAKRDTESGGRWLGALRGSWPLAVCRLLEARESPVVRVLVAEVRGSSPREPGACMLLSRAGSHGTIGGGNLE